MKQACRVSSGHKKTPNWSQLNWFAKLAYLADIFAVFNDLNSTLHGTLALGFTMADMIDGLKQKLQAVKSRV